jgi:LPXTG-site transpeptidase (sortase) family protein
MNITARPNHLQSLFIRLGLSLVILAGLFALPAHVVKAAPCDAITVTSLADSGVGTLRQAITDLCTGGTITFDHNLSGNKITLASVLTIDKTMTIDGSTLTKQITISGGNLTQIFNITGSGTLALKSIKIIDGHASHGGGISNDGILTITNSTIADNTAGSLGGGIRNDGSLAVINCTFSGNSSGLGVGGAILNGGTLVVKNSTFSGNSAGPGSGIANDTGSTMTIVNSSMFGNSGGALDNRGNMTIINTILAGTIGGNDCENLSGTISSASRNNLIQSEDSGAGRCSESGDTSYILGSDPKLSALADNGGPTQTNSLQAGSPAIDAGDYATCLSVEGGKDQRSVSRKDVSGKCDIGAFEVGTYLTPEVSSTTPAFGDVLTTSPSSLTVVFNKDVDSDSATKPANYLLAAPGTDGTFQTGDCLIGLAGDDKQIAINSVAYDSNTFTSTLTVNGGHALPNGKYELFVCGKTSIIDTVTTKLNNGTDDTRVDFTVNALIIGGTGSGASDDSKLPATGFTPGQVTVLPAQPRAYTGLNLTLEIPAIQVKAAIVGVPQEKSGWDVAWLGHDAGWLNGSAFPTWAGNSVITGHVWDADNQPGLFAGLKTLKYGDIVLIHAFGQVYTYEVRESQNISPRSTRTVMKHEDTAWLTLLTCEDFNSLGDSYSGRRMVRAVLLNISAEN